VARRSSSQPDRTKAGRARFIFKKLRDISRSLASCDCRYVCRGSPSLPHKFKDDLFKFPREFELTIFPWSRASAMKSDALPCGSHSRWSSPERTTVIQQFVNSWQLATFEELGAGDDGIEWNLVGQLGCALGSPRVERPLAAKESERSAPKNHCCSGSQTHRDTDQGAVRHLMERPRMPWLRRRASSTNPT
jgi:hypothetical protein